MHECTRCHRLEHRLRDNLRVTTVGRDARLRPTKVLGVASDLDGTLLRSDGSLSPATMSLLTALQELGVPLVVATARTPRAIRKITGHEHLGRVVCANGAVLWDARSGGVIWERGFDPTGLVAAVAGVREALPDAGVALLSTLTMFLDDAYVALRAKGAEGAETFSEVAHVLSSHRIVMVAVRHPRLTADQLLPPAAEAFAGFGTASFAGFGVVDIAPLAASKAVGVAEEMAERRCSAEATVVFGDMPNDLPLFAWGGWACAVANGHPEVLAAADEVVPRNDDDGVARTVQRLLGFSSDSPLVRDRSDAP